MALKLDRHLPDRDLGWLDDARREAAGHLALVPAVVAFDTFEDGFADGLLDRDFLDQFSVAMDPATGTVKLVPRQR